MLLRRKSVFSLLESLNADDAVLHSLGSSHSNDIGLYTGTKEKLPLLKALKTRFMKSSIKPTSVPVITFYTSAKMFLKEPSAVFVDQRTNPTSKVVELLKSVGTTRTRQAPLFSRSFSAVFVCTALSHRTETELGTLGLKVFSTRLSKRCRRFSRPLIPHSRMRWRLEKLLIRFHAILESAREGSRWKIMK